MLVNRAYLLVYSLCLGVFLINNMQGNIELRMLRRKDRSEQEFIWWNLEALLLLRLDLYLHLNWILSFTLMILIWRMFVFLILGNLRYSFTIFLYFFKIFNYDCLPTSLLIWVSILIWVLAMSWSFIILPSYFIFRGLTHYLLVESFNL
jgi:hypothetical protein